MKKLLQVTLLSLFIIFSISIPVASFATGPCDNLTVLHVGTAQSVASGVSVYLQNDSGVACTDFPIGQARLVNLSDKFTDKTLAVLLTAASLKKKVWAYTIGSSAPYILGSIQVKEISK